MSTIEKFKLLLFFLLLHAASYLDNLMLYICIQTNLLFLLIFHAIWIIPQHPIERNKNGFRNLKFAGTSLTINFYGHLYSLGD